MEKASKMPDAQHHAVPSKQSLVPSFPHSTANPSASNQGSGQAFEKPFVVRPVKRGEVAHPLSGPRGVGGCHTPQPGNGPTPGQPHKSHSLTTT